MSELMLLGGLPKVGLVGTGWFAFPGDASRQPLEGGPFASLEAARWWIVEYLERSLSDVQRMVWSRVMDGHHATRDAGLELGLMDMVKHGRSWEQIVKYLPGVRVDRKTLAAGGA